MGKKTERAKKAISDPTTFLIGLLAIIAGVAMFAYDDSFSRKQDIATSVYPLDYVEFKTPEIRCDPSSVKFAVAYYSNDGSCEAECRLGISTNPASDVILGRTRCGGYRDLTKYVKNLCILYEVCEPYKQDDPSIDESMSWKSFFSDSSLFIKARPGTKTQRIDPSQPRPTPQGATRPPTFPKLPASLAPTPFPTAFPTRKPTPGPVGR